MDENELLKVLERIKQLLKNDLLIEAKEYVDLEIENLKGITEQKCKNTMYYFGDFYCKYCENLNCSSNQNIES